MNKIVEKIETPINYECDVFVAGGGVAGIAAALSAARAGAKVILADRGFILGGLATAGLVTIYLPLCDGEGRQVSFGIAEELLRLSIEHGADAVGRHGYPGIWFEEHSIEERKADGKRYDVQFNPHYFAISAERVLVQNGVKILYGTTVASVSERDGRITEVIIESKSGREAVSVAKCVVDCTGDADVCARSSASTVNYGKSNTLAAWYYFTTEDAPGHNLKMYGFADVSSEPERAISKRDYHGLDASELSEMVIESHHSIENHLMQRIADGEKISPSCIATIPQIRMTRRLGGIYTLDSSEMHKRFDDSIGMVSDWRRRGPVYEVPFGTLRGKEVKNLLVAGRCVSVTDNMWDIARVIPDCAVTGQAAGLAAAMTDDLDTLSITELQARLVSAGVVLHEDELPKA